MVGILQETKADVLVCYLPVGSEQATKWYVEQALKAGVGFVNCLPVFIAREDYWDRPLPRGAGCRSSATTSSRRSAPPSSTASWRGCSTTAACASSAPRSSTSGGNMDFYNMLERERLASKKESKTNAVTSIMGHELPADDVYVGPSDYVRLADRPQVGPHQARGRARSVTCR